MSKRLTLSPEQIRVLTVTPVTWRDASLGCPKPNIDTIRVETPGYLVILAVGEKRYKCHTDMGRRVSFCVNK